MLKGSIPEVFLDTDVAFDILSKRKPHFDHSVKLLELRSRDRIALLLSESSLANLIYLSYDIYNLEYAGDRLSEFVLICEIIHGGKPMIIEALSSDFKDKEDALQYYTGLHHGADYFITRNTKDYKLQTRSLPVMTPADFTNSLK